MELLGWLPCGSDYPLIKEITLSQYMPHTATITVSLGDKEQFTYFS